MAWSETGKRFVVASSLTCFSISFHLFANRTEERNKARTRKRPKFIPKFIVRIVRDDQSLPDSIVKTESLSLSLSALDPVLFSRFRRPSRFIGECNFRWSRNPAEREAIRYTIYPIKLLELHRPTTIFNLFFRAFLLPFPLVALSSFVSPLFFRRVRINLTDTTPTSHEFQLFRVPNSCSRRVNKSFSYRFARRWM